MAIDYSIRSMKQEEYPILSDFLYEAIFQTDEKNPLPKSIIYKPELMIYIKDFGKSDDFCMCAESNGKIVGAAWSRIIDGYGSIDKYTPELVISLYKQFRGYGIGTELLKSIINTLNENGYDRVSLSVQKENYALKMYLNIGFKIVYQNEHDYIMVYYLRR